MSPSWMRQPRLLCLLSLLILIPVGLYSKIYNGPVEVWVNRNLGGLLYEIFWCLFFFLFFCRKKAITAIPVWVFLVTCAIELLQLWKNPTLVAIQRSLLGRLFLGTTFSWLDFPHYLLGCLIGWLWLKLIWRWGVKPNRHLQ